MKVVKYTGAFFLLGILLFTVSCQTDVAKDKNRGNSGNEDQLKVTDTCTVDGVFFELLQNPVTNMAELRMSLEKVSRQGAIQLSPPCYFLRRNKQLQMHGYPEIDVVKTLIILGDTIGREKKRYRGFAEADLSRICGAGIQGILIKTDSTIITSRTLTGGFRCMDTGADEKDFWDFAHNR